ncbi:HAMP domain-containing sensor histidine kinase [Microbacterium sp.]|uniref:sensor histidine kinase n=1 Tax=Microbacterium sp. TaxID=51671 RepID=UPI0031FE7A34|nr:HAMP domain-containing histidine kinase [Microbacterium sp.]
MPRTSLWLRVFVALLMAVLPPILLLVGAVLLANSVLQGVDPNLVAISVVVGTIAWAAILGIVYTRSMTDDLRSMLTLAERGAPSDESELGSAYGQLASALEERNRQIATLAREAAAVSIDDAPRRVVESLVAAIRPVMRDSTWRAAILSSDDPSLLATGVYAGSDEDHEPTAVGDLERWASVSTPIGAVGRRDGPWGAFAIVNIASSDRLSAILYAPWEGRADLSPAEQSLLALVGQHFGAAVEHALLYARVRTQADELDRLARIQADFLRGVTHDLQTPLTSIGALATELRADASLSAAAQGDLETITHQAERLRRMVSQLLVASRLEAGAFTPQIEVFAVPPLVQRTWAALRADRPFDLAVDGAPHLAVGDPDRLEQVLWALLDNAVKYSPEHSPIDVTVAPHGDELTITVRDHGSGMDEETARNAFEQFYRAPQARKLAPDGSGVGLYAARGLVDAMGGSIAIESALGAGSAVTIRLPAEPSASAE